jgi:hypothetical protein
MTGERRLEYTFYGSGPVVEFNERSDSGNRVAVIKVDDIVSIEEVDGDSTRIVLRDRRILIADHAYKELRRIVLEARRQFATLL